MFKSGDIVGKVPEALPEGSGRRRRWAKRAFGARLLQQLKAFPKEKGPDRVQLNHHLELAGAFSWAPRLCDASQVT